MFGTNIIYQCGTSCNLHDYTLGVIMFEFFMSNNRQTLFKQARYEMDDVNANKILI